MAGMLEGLSKDIMLKIKLTLSKYNEQSKEYPEELKKLPWLKFYLTKAYNYVWETFDFSLSHVGTIRRWYNSVDGEPGIN